MPSSTEENENALNKRILDDSENSSTITRINPYVKLVPIAVLYFITAFMVFPITSQVIIGLVCEQEDRSQDDDCTDAHISSSASMVTLYTTLSVTIPSILMSGPYGSIADKVGRRIILLISFAGLLSMVTCVYLVSSLRPSSFLYILIAGNIVMGSCGSVGIFQLGLFTYASDMTEHDKDKRTSLFSILESCTFIAKILGPLISGLWAKSLALICKQKNN